MCTVNCLDIVYTPVMLPGTDLKFIVLHVPSYTLNNHTQELLLSLKRA